MAASPRSHTVIAPGCASELMVLGLLRVGRREVRVLMNFTGLQLRGRSWFKLSHVSAGPWIVGLMMASVAADAADRADPADALPVVVQALPVGSEPALLSFQLRSVKMPTGTEGQLVEFLEMTTRIGTQPAEFAPAPDLFECGGVGPGGSGTSPGCHANETWFYPVDGTCDPTVHCVPGINQSPEGKYKRTAIVNNSAPIPIHVEITTAPPFFAFGRFSFDLSMDPAANKLKAVPRPPPLDPGEHVTQLTDDCATISQGFVVCWRAKLETGIRSLLKHTDGAKGFIVKPVGAAALDKMNETFAYEPASSIKTLVGVGMMKRVDDGSVVLNTTGVNYFPSDSKNCPTNAGAAQVLTAQAVLNNMLVNSDNPATRSLVDFQGGFAPLTQLAQSLGMPATQLNVYPGCGNTNRMTLVDADTMYEGIASNSSISASSETTLYANMAADAFDFTGTLGRTNQIVDALGPTFGLDARQIGKFKAGIRLHHKAGGLTWCAPICRVYLSNSGLAVFPTCNGTLVSTAEQVFGFFIHGAINGTKANETFAAVDGELLRGSLATALSGWSTCTPPIGTWKPGRNFSIRDLTVFNGLVYSARQAHTSQVGWEPPNVYALWARDKDDTGGAWAAQVLYATGDVVTFQSHRYRAIQGHQSQPDWQPPMVPALWQPVD